ncbi:MAG: guanylate kinase [Chitinophagaceae bacterium]|nr:guanylate kinase [Chitinophagaceae bacterium]
MQPASGKERIVILTAPSGSGKSTIVHYLLKTLPELKFSVSACTRSPRPGEIHGQSYYFISIAEFEQKIQENAFAEYEMVYTGKYYGTLKSELEATWNQGRYPLADIDVQGAMRLKKYFGAHALSIFIQAPSLQILEQRLRNRGTETEASLQERLEKAEHELGFADQFDHRVINDQLETACTETRQFIQDFLGLPEKP